MPPIGLVIGGVDFSGLQLTLKEATAAAPAVTVRYGVFLQAVIDFLIVAAAVFSVVKLLSRMQRKQAAAEAAGAAPLAPPVPSEEVKLLGEIRDLLRRDEAAART
jgi:large conductance mechanosensitive channel